jgi:hypothetical protein
VGGGHRHRNEEPLVRWANAGPAIGTGTRRPSHGRTGVRPHSDPLAPTLSFLRRQETRRLSQGGSRPSAILLADARPHISMVPFDGFLGPAFAGVTNECPAPAHASGSHHARGQAKPAIRVRMDVSPRESANLRVHTNPLGPTLSFLRRQETRRAAKWTGAAILESPQELATATTELSLDFIHDIRYHPFAQA